MATHCDRIANTTALVLWVLAFLGEREYCPSFTDEDNEGQND